MPRIKGIKFQNLFGIEELVIEVPADSAGIIFQGDNGLGKTSILRGIQAALVGRGIDETAIRKGASKGQAIIDLDNFSVRRVLGVGEKLEVQTADGFSAGKPAALLKQMLGTSSLDPLDLLLEKDAKKRQKAVLAACPATVTPEELRRWWPKCPDDYPCEGHALEVVERVRKAAYDKRTAANKDAKEKAAEAARLAREAKAAVEAAPQAEPDVAAAEKAYNETLQQTNALQSRKEQAEKQIKSTERQRAKVQELRARAASIRIGIEPVEQSRIDELRAKIAESDAEVARIKAELAKAEDANKVLCAACDLLVERKAVAQEQEKNAAEHDRQADDIEAALSEAAVAPVTDQEMLQALEQLKQHADAFNAARAGAKASAEALQAAEVAGKAHAASELAEQEAARLDGIVKALTEQAPAEILAKGQGIPGLTIAGDDIFLDGVSLDNCCGAERIRFAVQVAKRANGKSKILIVDELERLSSKNFEVFVQEATADGWELYGTRVSDDQRIVMVPIRRAPASDQAAE